MRWGLAEVRRHRGRHSLQVHLPQRLEGARQRRQADVRLAAALAGAHLKRAAPRLRRGGRRGRRGAGRRATRQAAARCTASSLMRQQPSPTLLGLRATLAPGAAAFTSSSSSLALRGAMGEASQGRVRGLG